MSSADIKPFVKLLADSYAVSTEEIRRTYRVGRIFGLRGGIVHAGDRRPIHGHLLLLLGALYADALAAVLGLAGNRNAERVLEADGFDLTDYL